MPVQDHVEGFRPKWKTWSVPVSRFADVIGTAERNDQVHTQRFQRRLRCPNGRPPLFVRNRQSGQGDMLASTPPSPVPTQSCKPQCADHQARSEAYGSCQLGEAGGFENADQRRATSPGGHYPNGGNDQG